MYKKGKRIEKKIKFSFCLSFFAFCALHYIILITIGAELAQVNRENVSESVKLDSPAFIENDRTYTPIRFISEKLGASVEWIEKEQKVVITKVK